MFDFRTVRAALVADLLTFVSIAGIVWFLGFAPVTALIAGAVAGTLAVIVILGAAGRAAKLGTDRPRPSRPHFPGPPEHRDAPDGGPSATSSPTDDTDDHTDDDTEDHRG